MNRTDIYRQAIKRAFADLYRVSSDTVDVAGRVQAKRFFHPILSDPDDDTPEFTCVDEDPVVVVGFGNRPLNDQPSRATPRP